MCANCTCCKRILNAVTPRDKAFAALESVIETGGYDHWSDLERYATEASKRVISNHDHIITDLTQE